MEAAKEFADGSCEGFSGNDGQGTSGCCVVRGAYAGAAYPLELTLVQPERLSVCKRRTAQLNSGGERARVRGCGQYREL